MNSTTRSALIIVENNSVPRDTRVWQIARSLKNHGWDITIISPTGTSSDAEPFVEIDGIAIHRISIPTGSGQPLGYLREYATAMIRIGLLARRLGRTKRFDVVHACNPPDFLLLLTLGLRRRGAATVFDHHDLSPELYTAKFSGQAGIASWLLRISERVGFSLADVVLATNESFRHVAVSRGRKPSSDVFIVRNGPDLRFEQAAPAETTRAGAPALIGYVGLMGAQDGVDVALEALAHLRKKRSDWHACFVGDGDALETARADAIRLGLQAAVTFTGFVSDRERLSSLLQSFDICLSPEPRNLLNEQSTLIKVAEYMAAGKPTVAFDLKETRHTAGSAALFAERDDPSALAETIEKLLDDPGARERMGREGKRRIRESLNWESSEKNLLAAYERALRRALRRSVRT